MKMVPLIKLASGEPVPALGQGTWNMGEDRRRRRAEIAALSLGLDLGMNLIDTAEMYADGGAEKIIRAAIPGRPHPVFLAHKVLPHNPPRRRPIPPAHPT